ncbi:thioredoxin-like protein [Laetiporus sulphureus 93-53]|uniref:Thioredoxin-like protein n=1 Tax=Laetiporus sulphureus 93-53 TaxID=1314785 RepID=A0A165H1C6_9APHY|nr:thioredoxin-like protein [Laetiporus sulphureus 93-53]KZT11108.1 thioredoxin-like protein [Laetiporus sulphureus 93-53]
MALNPNEDTEFNDALRKHGILPPKPPTPRTPSPPPAPTLEESLEGLSPEDLRALSEDAVDDESERIVERYRRKRLAELKKREKARFGRVYPIGREQYTDEVTEASKEQEEGKPEGHGTGVVCFLYKDGIPRSDRAFEHIRTLAARYPNTKFVSIVGEKCIPNLPEERIPMFIIYRNGEVINQLASWGADREKSIEELEAILTLAGAVVPELHPQRSDRENDRSDSDRDSEDEASDDEPSSRMRSAGTHTNRSTGKNIRTPAKDDSDSDFDL